MAKKQFALNTQPHEAEIGDAVYLFEPEVLGDEFLDRYERLQEVNRRLNFDPANMGDAHLSQVREATTAMRVFLASLMLPASAHEFARWDVLADGSVTGSYATPADAGAAAADLEGAEAVDGGTRYPDRVLVELMEWVVELYGGGQRPPTSSTGSAPASPPPGRRGRAVSR
ncbi:MULTISPECIES: hypothetical protein [unclassified Streptomyces]|uniref:hypothetical protein n=1 Tax=unclassified Streptomyces TaxID=2593676 RepID=UPI0020242014|nr:MULTISPECIES: hypothetical protein [unclassified Streptomyces]MCX4550614.1 hypothetical protein [Streptomyces sp. NBC_01500]WSC22059.1 hypothetical protein OIE60_21525 [Streptomyces sp. NBC_01766]